ncbi:MAG: hypothetical protein ACRC7O_02955, partial [Fimbriiglobus sp.]
GRYPVSGPISRRFARTDKVMIVNPGEMTTHVAGDKLNWINVPTGLPDTLHITCLENDPVKPPELFDAVPPWYYGFAVKGHLPFRVSAWRTGTPPQTGGDLRKNDRGRFATYSDANEYATKLYHKHTEPEIDDDSGELFQSVTRILVTLVLPEVGLSRRDPKAADDSE